MLYMWPLKRLPVSKIFQTAGFKVPQQALIINKTAITTPLQIPAVPFGCAAPFLEVEHKTHQEITAQGVGTGISNRCRGDHAIDEIVLIQQIEYRYTQDAVLTLKEL